MAAKTPRRDTLTLAVGSALNGLLAYAVFALTTRALGPEAAAPVSVLWSYWAFAGAAFTFPVQHWAARTLVVDGEAAVAAALPRLAGVVLAASGLLGVLAFAAREPLFHTPDPWFAVMTGLITLGAAATGVMRGGLAGRGRFGAVGTSLAAENAIRCVVVGGLALAGVQDATAYGAGLVSGQLVVLLWPSALRFARGRSAAARSRPFAFLAGASLAQLANQTVLTGSPVVLALAGGSAADVTSLFAALALFRAPYMLGLGLVSQLTTTLTRLVVSEDVGTLRRIRLLLVGAAIPLALVAAGLGATVGPPLLRLVFGSDVELGAAATAVTAAGCAVAIANLVLTVGSIARDRPRSAAHAWLVAVAAAALSFLALGGTSPLDRTLTAFLVAEVVAFGALLVVEIAVDRRR